MRINLTQGRREPNEGPGSAQILGISGFVNSKTDGENATSFVKILKWSQKKNLPLGCPDLTQLLDMKVEEI